MFSIFCIPSDRLGATLLTWLKRIFFFPSALWGGTSDIFEEEKQQCCPPIWAANRSDPRLSCWAPTAVICCRYGPELQSNSTKNFGETVCLSLYFFFFFFVFIFAPLHVGASVCVWLIPPILAHKPLTCEFMRGRQRLPACSEEGRKESAEKLRSHVSAEAKKKSQTRWLGWASTVTPSASAKSK